MMTARCWLVVLLAALLCAPAVAPVELWGDTDVMFHACKANLEFPDQFVCKTFTDVEISKVNALRLNKAGIKTVVSAFCPFPLALLIAPAFRSH